MTTIPTLFTLPAAMTIEDCQKLHGDLQAATDYAVTIDCSGVSRLHGLGAQLICMSRKFWLARDIPFKLVNISPRCRENLETLGLTDLCTDDGDAA